MLGHNTITGQHLRQFVERIERLEEDKKAITQDVKEAFQEAKGNGFCVKTMRKIIALRKLDSAEREEQESLLDLYQQALGMTIGKTPLEEAIENKGAK